MDRVGTIIAKCLSARHLILLRSRIAFVCMYVRHTLIADVWVSYILGMQSNASFGLLRLATSTMCLVEIEPLNLSQGVVSARTCI